MGVRTTGGKEAADGFQIKNNVRNDGDAAAAATQSMN
jgi:hypothetical protein